MVLAKSDKHTGFEKFIRLVRDKEGHALSKKQCKFNKLDFLTINATSAPLKHQRENYILNELIQYSKSSVSVENLKKYIQNPEFIFSSINPWFSEKEIDRQKTSFYL